MYGINGATEWVKDSLELTLLEKADLPLIMLVLTFMFIVNDNWAIGKGCKVVKVVENNVFTNSLIGITIQDSGKREISDVVSLPLFFLN